MLKGAIQPGLEMGSCFAQVVAFQERNVLADMFSVVLTHLLHHSSSYQRFDLILNSEMQELKQK